MQLNKIHRFKNKEYDTWWRIHPSLKPTDHFDRMEFIGDRVVSLSLTKFLLCNTSYTAGQLSNHISILASGKNMSYIGKFLSPFLRYSGDLTPAMIADALEAYIGAVFLDNGDTETIILSLWKDCILNYYDVSPKNQLQELLQAHNKTSSFQYELLPSPDHRKQFKCTLRVDNMVVYSNGKSKKEASMNAAKNFLEQYNKTFK